MVDLIIGSILLLISVVVEFYCWGIAIRNLLDYSGDLLPVFMVIAGILIVYIGRFFALPLWRQGKIYKSPLRTKIGFGLYIFAAGIAPALLILLGWEAYLRGRQNIASKFAKRGIKQQLYIRLDIFVMVLIVTILSVLYFLLDGKEEYVFPFLFIVFVCVMFESARFLSPHVPKRLDVVLTLLIVTILPALHLFFEGKEEIVFPLLFLGLVYVIFESVRFLSPFWGIVIGAIFSCVFMAPVIILDLIKMGRTGYDDEFIEITILSTAVGFIASLVTAFIKRKNKPLDKF